MRPCLIRQKEVEQAVLELDAQNLVAVEDIPVAVGTVVAVDNPVVEGIAVVWGNPVAEDTVVAVDNPVAEGTVVVGGNPVAEDTVVVGDIEVVWGLAFRADSIAHWEPAV